MTANPWLERRVFHWTQGRTITDKRLVAAAHRAGLAVHVWTLDDPMEVRGALDLGADGIMTDRPSVVAGALAERGVAWRP